MHIQYLILYCSLLAVVDLISEINECESSPCWNGTCVDLINYFECDCHGGYNGTLCDIGKVYLYKIYIKKTTFQSSLCTSLLH